MVIKCCKKNDSLSAESLVCWASSLAIFAYRVQMAKQLHFYYFIELIQYVGNIHNLKLIVSLGSHKSVFYILMFFLNVC